jgi:hypothetical protein
MTRFLWTGESDYYICGHHVTEHETLQWPIMLTERQIVICRGVGNSKMSSSILCRQCNQPITFDNKRISQKTGKKIPLDPGTNEPHDCPVHRDQPPQQQSQQQTQRLPPMLQRLRTGNLL